MPPAASASPKAVIAAGADIIFGQGDGASFGMLQAVETTKATDGGKVWFIDVIGDKTPIDKGNLLSSVVWDIEPVYAAMIEDLKADKFGTKRLYDRPQADDSVAAAPDQAHPGRCLGRDRRRCAKTSSTARSRSSRSTTRRRSGRLMTHRRASKATTVGCRSG